jgi:serine/threonine protein kinase
MVRSLFVLLVVSVSSADYDLGKWKFDDVAIPARGLEEEEKYFEGEEKRMFLAFLRKMLQWRPEDRQTAKELLTDPWFEEGHSELGL